MGDQLYKACSHCPCITDKNEERCPCCGQNPFIEGTFTFPELISLIKKGEIALQRIWTKNPEDFHEALKDFLP